MDVELEQVVELIGEGGDGTCDRFGDAIAEGERSGGLVASVEWDILEFTETVGDLFAIAVSDTVVICVSGPRSSQDWWRLHVLLPY